MMNKVQIEDKFSISEQITLNDIKELADDKVKILICNRPDGEEPHQITSSEIKTTANQYGIEFIHIPVNSREIPQESLCMFTEVVDSCDQKIHAYCKTGIRSAIFWALCHARNHPTNKTLEKARAAGFDLTPIINQIEAINQK